MKKIRRIFLAILFAALLSSCAMVEKPEIKTIDEKTKISKTIQHKKANIGNKKGLKRKIAIARFTNETKYGQSFFIDDNNDRIGKQAVDILSSKLIATNKFILIERADLDKITKELAMENYQPLKNMADYLIVGSVTEFGRKDQGEVGIFSRTKKQIAFAKVHVRLIEVRSGQILYSEEGEGEAFSEAGTVFGVGGRAGYNSAINDKALDAAITNLASNIIENLLDRPWKSYILGFEDGKLIIAGGKLQNINVGDVFKVMKEGKKVKNPQTNMMITLPGRQIGKIKAVMSVGDTPETEVTLCEIIDGNFEKYIVSKAFNQLFIQEN
ncbi:MAG: curli production assembly protein CsgG [Deltaproteobacteria bacterium]|nr:curli production assembly protein CsgG [Deltaproteobacteria bacterium]